MFLVHFNMSCCSLVAAGNTLSFMARFKLELSGLSAADIEPVCLVLQVLVTPQGRLRVNCCGLVDALAGRWGTWVLAMPSLPPIQCWKTLIVEGDMTVLFDGDPNIPIGCFVLVSLFPWLLLLACVISNPARCQR